MVKTDNRGDKNQSLCLLIGASHTQSEWETNGFITRLRGLLQLE